MTSPGSAVSAHSALTLFQGANHLESAMSAPKGFKGGPPVAGWFDDTIAALQTANVPGHHLAMCLKTRVAGQLAQPATTVVKEEPPPDELTDFELTQRLQDSYGSAGGLASVSHAEVDTPYQSASQAVISTPQAHQPYHRSPVDLCTQQSQLEETAMRVFSDIGFLICCFLTPLFSEAVFSDSCFSDACCVIYACLGLSAFNFSDSPILRHSQIIILKKYLNKNRFLVNFSHKEFL